MESIISSSSPAFLLMYSAYKLNKQSANIQPWCTPFPIWNQSVVPCPVLTVASWHAYRFLKRQVRRVWYSHLFQNFPQFIIIHTVKGFGIVKKAQIDVFLELSCFFDDSADVANLIEDYNNLIPAYLQLIMWTSHIWAFLLLLLLSHFSRVQLCTTP